MNVGIFNEQTDGALFGNLPTMNLRDVSLEPVTKKGNGPDYRASIEGAELGAAWKERSEGGKDYLRFTVTIPGQKPVYLAIFATKTPGQFVVVWSESKKSRTDDSQPE